MGKRIKIAAAAVVVALGISADAAAGDFQFGLYGGWSGSFDSDATFKRGDSDFTLHSIPWEGLSFDYKGGAPYYGIRGTYWLNSTPMPAPKWGIMLDYTHAKVRAEGSAKVKATGTYMGKPAPNQMKISNTFSRFEFTDGLNLLTLNAVRQLPSLGVVHPYLGGGLGIARPHVEVTGPGFPKTFEYQVTGLAAQILAGVDVPLTEHFSIFSEYKLSYAGVDADLSKGGHLNTNVWTNHILVGASLRFGSGS